MTMAFPASMMPLLPYLQGVEILGDIVKKIDEQGKQKNRDGVPQWQMSVIVPQGRLLTEQRITVISQVKPDFSDGDHVVFPDIHVGAYGSGSGAGLYLWATDVRAAREG